MRESAAGAIRPVGAAAEHAERPLIGISAYGERARWGAWDRPAILLPRRYTDMVTLAGAIPVLLPPVAGIGAVISRLDGLILSGGGDIDPARYGAQRAEQTGPANAGRDAAELALCVAAMSAGLPLLGICRGLQVINVARGGTLHQHLPAVVGHDEHSPAPGRHGLHDVRVAAGTRLAGILGRADGSDHLPVGVPTHHHQGIDRLGSGLAATAWAADGTIEAIEADAGEHPFLVGVQWHPEAGDDPSLFQALAAASQARTAGVAG